MMELYYQKLMQQRAIIAIYQSCEQVLRERAAQKQLIALARFQQSNAEFDAKLAALAQPRDMTGGK